MTLPTKTTLEELGELADELRAALSKVLDVSNVTELNMGSGVVFVGNPYRWKPLDPSHQAYVGDAQEAYERWDQLASGAVRASALDRLEKFTKTGKVLRRVIKQSSAAPAGDIPTIRAEVDRALDSQQKKLGELPAAQRPPERLLVPDTNAFIGRPDIEVWKVDGNPWTVVVLPQVVRELDEKKMRSDAVGEKAKKVIKRLKEYGRRGDTFKGVTVAGKLSLREVAIDADMDDAPSWLRAEHADDQLLAAALELKWRHLTSTVAIVTGDRNLQNKARFAQASYVDIDEL